MLGNHKFPTKSHLLAALGTIAVSIFLLAILWWVKGDTFLAGLYSIKSRDGQLMHIASAVTRYQMRHQSPPSSLSNLVSEGLLPDSSSLYASSLVRWKYNTPPVRFVESDYEIVPTTNGAFARLKPGLIEQLKQNKKLPDTALNSYFSIFVHIDERIIFDPEEKSRDEAAQSVR